MTLYDESEKITICFEIPITRKKEFNDLKGMSDISTFAKKAFLSKLAESSRNQKE